MGTTWCMNVANDIGVIGVNGGSVYILDKEDERYSLNVPSHRIRKFEQGIVFPWCSSTDEIEKKAFRVYEGDNKEGVFLFYMFQNYENNMIYYSLDGKWSGISKCSEVVHQSFNVLITREKVPICSEFVK